MWVVLQHLTIYKCATEEHFPCALCCPEGKAHLLVVFTVLMQVSSWCAAVGLAGISSCGSEQKKGWCFQWGCCVLWQPQFLSYLEQCKWRTCAACLKVPWKHRSVWKWAAFFFASYARDLCVLWHEKAVIFIWRKSWEGRCLQTAALWQKAGFWYGEC